MKLNWVSSLQWGLFRNKGCEALAGIEEGDQQTPKQTRRLQRREPGTHSLAFDDLCHHVAYSYYTAEPCRATMRGGVSTKVWLV